MPPTMLINSLESIRRRVAMFLNAGSREERSVINEISVEEVRLQS